VLDAAQGARLGTATLSTSDGATTASITAGQLALGAHNILAVYSGDSKFSSSSVLVQVVDKAATTSAWPRARTRRPTDNR